MIDLVKEESRVDQQVRRAQKLGLPATLTTDEWIATLTIFNGLCAYCRQNAFEVLEHIIPLNGGGGTTVDNCVPACQRCNTRKREHVAPDAHPGESHDKAIERILAFLQTHPSIPRKLTTSSVWANEHDVSAACSADGALAHPDRAASSLPGRRVAGCH